MPENKKLLVIIKDIFVKTFINYRMITMFLIDIKVECADVNW